MKRLRAFFPTFYLVYRWWSHRLTAGGKTLSLALFLALVSVLDGSFPMGELLAAIVAVVLVVLACNRLARPQLSATMLRAPSPRVGQSLPLPLQFTNQGFLVARDLNLRVAEGIADWASNASDQLPSTAVNTVTQAEPYVVLDRVAVGANVQVTLLATPRRRGLLTAPTVEVVSTFPFDLVKTHRNVAPSGEILVHPARAPISNLLLAEIATNRAGMDAAGTWHTGDSDDYLGNRDYLAGSPTRRFDFRSWARLGRPIVREYREVHPPAVTLVVDTLLPSQQHGDTLEQAISLAASLVDFADESSVAIEGLLVGRELTSTSLEGDRLPGEAMLDLLAGATSWHAPDQELQINWIAQQSILSRSLVVILVSWDEVRRAWVDHWLREGYSISGCVIMSRLGVGDLQTQSLASLPEFLVPIQYSAGEPWQELTAVEANSALLSRGASR